MELITIALFAITFLLTLVVASIDLEFDENNKNYAPTYIIYVLGVWLLAMVLGVIAYVAFSYLWTLL